MQGKIKEQQEKRQHRRQKKEEEWRWRPGIPEAVSYTHLVDEEFLTMKGLEVPENLEEFQQELEGMGFTETAAYFK